MLLAFGVAMITPLCVSPTSLLRRCSWVFRVKNERQIGLIDLLVSATRGDLPRLCISAMCGLGDLALSVQNVTN